jgi:hypothetical protein
MMNHKAPLRSIKLFEAFLVQCKEDVVSETIFFLAFEFTFITDEIL